MLRAGWGVSEQVSKMPFLGCGNETFSFTKLEANLQASCTERYPAGDTTCGQQGPWLQGPLCVGTQTGPAAGQWEVPRAGNLREALG